MTALSLIIYLLMVLLLDAAVAVVRPCVGQSDRRRVGNVLCTVHACSAGMQCGTRAYSTVHTHIIGSPQPEVHDNVLGQNCLCFAPLMKEWQAAYLVYHTAAAQQAACMHVVRCPFRHNL